MNIFSLFRMEYKKMSRNEAYLLQGCYYYSDIVWLSAIINHVEGFGCTNRVGSGAILVHGSFKSATCYAQKLIRILQVQLGLHQKKQMAMEPCCWGRGRVIFRQADISCSLIYLWRKKVPTSFWAIVDGLEPRDNSFPTRAAMSQTAMLSHNPSDPTITTSPEETCKHMKAVVLSFHCSTNIYECFNWLPI